MVGAPRPKRHPGWVPTEDHKSISKDQDGSRLFGKKAKSVWIEASDIWHPYHPMPPWELCSHIPHLGTWLHDIAWLLGISTLHAFPLPAATCGHKLVQLPRLQLVPECIKVGKVSFQHAYEAYDLLHIATLQYLSDGADESWGGSKVKVEQLTIWRCKEEPCRNKGIDWNSHWYKPPGSSQWGI